jgi:CheY-like chemotaxis protein
MDGSNSAGRLLAIDDNLDSAELIVRVARKCGYDARLMADTRALRQTLSDWKPEVLTLDLSMPQDDGIALLSLLQDSGFDGQIVIISGHDDWLRKAAGRLAALRGLNVADALGKPIDLQALRKLLTNLREAA